MRDTLAMLLAGGEGSRLNVLAHLRVKPAVPFGGIYRIIDFTLSNVMNSGLTHVGILAQYRPYSLMKHVGIGAPWDLVGRTRELKILPPQKGTKDSDWYKGTADAIAQNLDYIHRHKPKRVLILSGDHIYHMDYTTLVEFHQQKGADLTIAMREVPLEEAHHFGIGIVDQQDRLIAWEEKPAVPSGNLASMGVYVFNTDFLLHCLATRTGHDFGKNIIPRVLQHKVYAYRFEGYWQDVGTIKAYWEAHMDLLDKNSGLDLNAWGVVTNFEEEDRKGDRPPVRFGTTTRVTESILSCGAVIEGEVYRSVLSPGVRVAKGARVSHSVIMHDTVIGKGAVVDRAIIDKNVVIGDQASIGFGPGDTPNQKFPDHLFNGLTVIGKNATIPPGTKIGRNCIIFPEVTARHFREKELPCGSTIEVEDGEW
ncbi:MAG: sugar phosphate nucleotidyltransferase [candidate division KSB1 bacterium]|nr:sugar phosphate nucleotidyltransferase [candidate division KSB1 bacterium]